MKYDRFIGSSDLEPLRLLEQRTASFAEMCLPDHLCEVPELHQELKFVALDLDGSTRLTGEEISLQIKGEQHLLTEWSRHQILQHLGTKEKWFQRVTLQDQARELHRRIHTFDRHRFKRMGSYDGVSYIRGLVSATYADIPDLDVIRALCQAAPDGECLRSYSGVSDKAFYAYLLTREAPLGIGDDVVGYPGAIVRNSEVGASSLSVVPFFLLAAPGGFVAPVALRKHALLRKVHRGQYAELAANLADAIARLSGIWGPLQARIKGLVSRSYKTEDEALGHLESALLSIRKNLRFTAACTTAYRAAKNPAHNGLTLLTAVLEACATGALDGRYADAEVAGYLLLYLL